MSPNEAYRLGLLMPIAAVSAHSLYASFGDKEALYLKALERYIARQLAPHAAALDAEPHGRQAVEGYLRSIAKMLADPALPGGCFIINGMADCGGPSTPVAIDLALCKALQGGEVWLRERLLRAQRDGQLAPDVHVGNLAALFSSLVAGLGVLAKSGAKRAKLYAIITVAMGAWPTPLEGNMDGR